MVLRVRIAARTANQVRKASEWWSVNRPNAPNAIATDFGEAVALLAEQPGIGDKSPNIKARAPLVYAAFFLVALGTSSTTRLRKVSFMYLRFVMQAGSTSRLYNLA